jgi:SAM-dependent methyltransferase
MNSKGNLDEYASMAEFYDHVVPYRNRQDVPFFVEMARQAEGPVLEIGCGTGRVLIPTARAGIEIAGLDLSESMLSLCRNKLEREPEEVQSRVRLVKADMRQFEIERQFSLVTMPFRPFQHLLTVEDQLSCLACVRRHLREDGKFVLDLFNPDLKRLTDDKCLTDWEEEPEFTMPDGCKVVRRIRITSRDYINQIQEVEFSHSVKQPDGQEVRLYERFRMRYLFRFEAEHLLERSGLRVEHLYGDYDKSPCDSKHPRELIFVTRKI